MTIPVLLSIKGKQSYEDQEPDEIELITEGTLSMEEGCWVISYEESEMTGLQGVTTTFRIISNVVSLERTGALNSKMVFKEKEFYHSLYQMEFGALMLTVFPARVLHNITWEGGTVDLIYGIEIENTASGLIEYHLDITPRKRK